MTRIPGFALPTSWKPKLPTNIFGSRLANLWWTKVGHWTRHFMRWLTSEATWPCSSKLVLAWGGHQIPHPRDPERAHQHGLLRPCLCPITVVAKKGNQRARQRAASSGWQRWQWMATRNNYVCVTKMDHVLSVIANFTMDVRILKLMAQHVAWHTQRCSMPPPHTDFRRWINNRQPSQLFQMMRQIQLWRFHHRWLFLKGTSLPWGLQNLILRSKEFHHHRPFWPLHFTTAGLAGWHMLFEDFAPGSLGSSGICSLLTFISAGGHGHLEQPPSAMSWLKNCAQQWLTSGGFHCVNLAACAFGRDWPKSWLFASSFQTLTEMACICPHPPGHHQKLAGVRDATGGCVSRRTAEYPEQLAQQFATIVLPLAKGSLIDFSVDDLLPSLPNKGTWDTPIANVDGLVSIHSQTGAIQHHWRKMFSRTFVNTGWNWLVIRNFTLNLNIILHSNARSLHLQKN